MTQWIMCEPVTGQDIHDGALSFDFVPGASQKGRALLFDTAGYSYNVKVSATV